MNPILNPPTGNSNQEQWNPKPLSTKVINSSAIAKPTPQAIPVANQFGNNFLFIITLLFNCLYCIVNRVFCQEWNLKK
ncbi:MAG: hypothetical protein PHG83_02110 [Patescibacteria group bacterium]|nr:hypothetical protein [Patescibacteria group bacterium]